MRLSKRPGCSWLSKAFPEDKEKGWERKMEGSSRLLGSGVSLIVIMFLKSQ